MPLVEGGACRQGEPGKPGAPPLQDFEGHFLLVNLEKDEGRIADDATPAEGGLIPA